MARLILTRHGESEFNAKSLWTGIWDVPLTDKGRGDAKLMGKAMADLHPDIAFTSALTRARDTQAIIVKTNGLNIPVHTSAALNERDYGSLTGLNKWEVQEKYGETQFQLWRRGWNEPVPGGETLSDVYDRAIPYFEQHILPELKAGRNVLVTAHGNTLRALIKYLDHLSDEQILLVEMPFGEILVYEVGKDGRVIHKDVRGINSSAPPA